MSFLFFPGISPGQIKFNFFLDTCGLWAMQYARQKGNFNKDVFPTATFNIAIERGIELSGKHCSFVRRELLINGNEEFFLKKIIYI